jgi:hypothetical protein
VSITVDIHFSCDIPAVVTSADIDSIAIHLFSISFYWARKENGKFKNKVYVLLQKQKPELYLISTFHVIFLDILEGNHFPQDTI